MPSDEIDPQPSNSHNQFLQWIGVAWTLVYAFLAWRHWSSTGDQGTWLVFLMSYAPIACVLVTFAFLRAGGILAFIVLGLATWMMLGEAQYDMKNMPQAMSAVLMLAGGPIVLMRGVFVYFRRNSVKADP